MNVKTVEIVHEGGMRLVARTGSGHSVVMDDGEGSSGARPTELVAAALGACTAMDVLSILDKKRQDFDRYAIHVRAVQREAYPQVFTEIEIVHEVEGPGVDVAAVRRCIELSATKYCPVSAMLSAGATEIHHRYRVIRTGDAPSTEEGEVLVTGPGARPDIVD
jgi:putative redox protein